MLGHFDIQLKDLPRGITDAHLLELLTPAGKATPELDRLLARLPTRQRAKGCNLINDNFAGYTHKYCFSGGAISTPYNIDGGNAALGTILLMTNDAEPTYTEASSQYTNPNALTGTVQSTTAGKRFIEDDIDPHLMDADPNNNGRESILFRSRFLYLSTQANSNDIRSLGIYFSDNGNSTGTEERGRIARIRLKDSGGTPIILNKTSAQVLLIEYRFTLVTI